MKTLTLSQRHRRTSPFVALRAFVAKLDIERRIRRDTARLEAMSDHELRDIGLHRGDIRDALRHGRDWYLRGH
ncbi:MAG TPA: DUF1127 domain-containing protein [Amaricoccus sp.]|uniref:DUF1127 domain-containing protein n=1 Tax=Amaricoccus sp. TaxID=1872485 RepID=UPI002C4FACF0|nr:DUF1127 domain-containing protein [Amaricoccus sp.]HMQ94866.1 DUF1127 domain-containing protein [Amaricoccus sp.]HMR54671.1 DUF1127 domain-containing protein [Amaricoccus sp.]HMU01707.1 DUF1127 domain-containing protein [Amaricoccus sp.]